jgi:hypothetical protein
LEAGGGALDCKGDIKVARVLLILAVLVSVRVVVVVSVGLLGLLEFG